MFDTPPHIQYMLSKHTAKLRDMRETMAPRPSRPHRPPY